jgi:hypothetical protein
MSRFRSLMSQSPAIVISIIALALSTAGGATAATVMSNSAATPVVWHNFKLINGWTYGGFNSFHASYYVDSNHVVHLRGSVRAGKNGTAAFQLPRALRPSRVLSMVIYTDYGPAEMEISPAGYVLPFDLTPTNSHVRDFTSFDGVSFPEG